MVSDAEPLRVLVVDDEQSIRLLLRRWVERSLDDAQVFEAEDGLQALEKITEDGADIVITDLKMPVLSGTDLLTLLHADPRRSRMEVLVATQMASEKTSGWRQIAARALNAPIEAPVTTTSRLSSLQSARMAGTTSR